MQKRLFFAFDATRLTCLPEAVSFRRKTCESRWTRSSTGSQATWGRTYQLEPPSWEFKSIKSALEFDCDILANIKFQVLPPIVVDVDLQVSLVPFHNGRARLTSLVQLVRDFWLVFFSWWIQSDFAFHEISKISWLYKYFILNF